VIWVLDTHYPHLFHQSPQAEKSVFVYGVMESALSGLMEEIEADYPLVKTFSLPKVSIGAIRGHIELGVKGEPSQTELAFERLLAWMTLHNAEYALTGATQKA